jgi:hypothetical protein
MAVSDISIANRALQKLGATAITSLDEANAKARAMNLALEPVRRAELRRRRWRFAIKRVTLPALADAPDSGYDRQFQLPNDYLRLIEGGDLQSCADLSDYRSGGNALYSVEGGRLLTNLPAPLSIRYIADITDASLFDAAFVESFATRLALETCEPITESSSKKADLDADYRRAIREAAAANAFEKASESVADDTWVTARAQ